VPLAAIADKRISDRALRVFAALASFANREGRCWPSQEAIAEMLGVSRQAIGQHVGALKKLGYVSLERRIRRAGGWAANAYVLHDPPLVNGAPVADMATVQALALQR
jgi:DNA-binding transcriptional ArsR family regulator